MRTTIAEKLLKIVNEIDERAHVSLTRLTVLKKWFEPSGRLPAFAIWVGSRASSRKEKTGDGAAALFRQARALLAGVDPVRPHLDRQAAETLHYRLQEFQNEHQNQRWGPVRLIRDWDLMLVEQALAIWLWHGKSPAHGYKLAADYCKHYDSRYGKGLNGPSRTKIQEIVRFMFLVEAREEDGR